MQKEETFDELIATAIKAVDVQHYYEPRHLSRKDLRAWRRNAWLREFDTQLAIGALVSASLCVFLMVLAIVVSL
jgi:hypothetical protein